MPMRVDVLGVVSVRGDDAVIAGRALGGRRARLVLVALAVGNGALSGERLAQIVWGDTLPATWPVALRGVVSGIRTVCRPLGGSEQELIATTPSGYRLGDGVQVDIAQADADVATAGHLLLEGRYRAVTDLMEPITRMAGDQLLAGEDADWLVPCRRSVDANAIRAVELMVEACSQLGDHHRAIETARRGLDRHPIDESLHRALIAALARSGDRAGAAAAYESCRAMLADELGVDPSAETVQVYLAALRGSGDTAIAPVPVATTSFVGREKELAALKAALAHPGLVTVTGQGGVGKSRLAARVAAGHTTFSGGRLWVPLASMTDDELVASHVALEVGLAFGTGDPAAALADQLAPLGRVLLVLDGCEGAPDGAASLVAALLGRAPMLTVLATSRTALAVDGEILLGLDPLPAPTADGPVEANGQIRLLVDRVREAGGTLPIDADMTPHLIALCERCGGLPLALELVAAHLASMPAGDLVDHLAGISPGPQDSLRAIARSSYLALDDDEAAVFRRLGVLDGTVGLPVIREVVAYPPVTPIRVVRILRELTARGLLTVDRTSAHWRYQQDDDLHRFAGELLTEHGEARDGYAHLADAIRARLPDDARAAPAAFREQISEVLGSVRSLFAAGIAGRADIVRCQELAFRLHRYFASTSLHEGRYWLDRLLTAHPSGPWAAHSTYALGYLSYWAGDTDRAMRELQAAVAQLDGERDSYRARALIFLAGLLDDVDRGTEAIEHVRLSIEAAATHDIDLQCSAAIGMGSVLAERGDASAATYAADAIALCRRGGSIDQLAIALPTAATICWQVGDLDSARSYIAEALPLNTGSARIARVVLLSAAAGVAFADGDLTAALEFGTNADREGTELGVEREMPLIRSVLARILLARGDRLGAARLAVGAIQAALAMPVDAPLAICLETAALVLANGDPPTGPAFDRDIAEFLASAAAVRARGDRPAAPSLAAAVEALRARVSADVRVACPPSETAVRARDRLADVCGTVTTI